MQVKLFSYWRRSIAPVGQERVEQVFFLLLKQGAILFIRGHGTPVGCRGKFEGEVIH